MARRKLEEPERWITVNGAHLPVYPDGRIGAPGQTESSKSTSTSSNKKEIKPYVVSNGNEKGGFVTFADSEETAKANYKKQFRGAPADNLKTSISRDKHYLEVARRKTAYANEGPEKDVVASYRSASEIPSKLNPGESIVLKRNLGKGKFEYEGKGTYGTQESPTEVAINSRGFTTAAAAKKAMEERSAYGSYQALVVNTGKDKGVKTTSKNARYDTSRATHGTSSNTDVSRLSNGKSQLPNIRSTKNKTYSRGEKVAASVGAFGNNKKAIKNLKSENRRSMLIEIAENAGVSSSKLRKMDTEDILAMLLSMLRA